MDKGQEILVHVGRPHDADNTPHSGRYPWMSGDNVKPIKDEEYLFSEQFLKDVETLEKKGLVRQIDIVRELANMNPEWDKRLRDSKRNLSTGEFRAEKSAAEARKRIYDINYVDHMTKKGYNNREIARRMGLGSTGESTVRNLKDEIKQKNYLKNVEVADLLHKEMEKTGYVDVGEGINRYLGVTDTTLRNAVKILKDEGYNMYYESQRQLGTGHKTPVKFIGGEKGVYDWKKAHNAYLNNQLTIPNEAVFKEIDNGELKPIPKHEPVSISSKRVMIRYEDQGGKDRDGCIELRRGVDELDLEKNHYAQVRIACDDKYYMKGMAFYGDDKDFPPGIDIIYNCKHDKDWCINEAKTGFKEENRVTKNDAKAAIVGAMKEMKKNKYLIEDPTATLGSYISRQNDKIDEKTGKVITKGAINIINEEYGEHSWDNYSKNLASQFLSKQSDKLIEKQLDLAIDLKKAQYDTYNKITNPIIKKKYLEDFAEECDSDAVYLKAAPMPRQSSNVLLPIKTLKNDEIYAPSFKDGERIALIRYPHAGQFEIPILQNNKKNVEGKKIIGNQSINAVGINGFNLQVLSGADCDGDTVICIPLKGKEITNMKRDIQCLKELNDFDTSDWSFKKMYPDYEKYKDTKYKTISEKYKNKQMGIVSNLITDMTIKGAPISEIVRAVKHSMVVIDSEKHKLDWKASEKMFGIKQLRDKYQNNGIGKRGNILNGASTIVSRAKSEAHMQKYSYYKIDPKTGEKIYVPKMVDKTEKIKYIDPKTGEEKEYQRVIRDEQGNKIKILDPNTQKTYKMSTVKDAMDLVSDKSNKVEILYANYANELKKMANEARKKTLEIPKYEINNNSKEIYKKEIDSLNAKLNIALTNKPLERRAQKIGERIYKIKEEQVGYIDDGDRKRIQNICLQIARQESGANKKKREIRITPEEWKAIQANAISYTKLEKIIENTNKDILRNYTMPKQELVMTPSKVSLVKSMIKQGYDASDVAKYIGVSPTTISNVLKK